MQAKQTIRQNIAWLLLANLVSKPLWFLFLLLSARILGPEEFGKYMLPISFMSVSNGIFEGGIDIHSVRTLASDASQFPRFFFHTTVIKIGSTLLAGAGAYLLSLVVPSLAPNRTLLVIAIVYCAAFVTMTHFRSVIRAFEILRYEAWSIFFEKTFVLVLCGFALVFIPTAIGYGAFFSAAYLIASGLTLWIIYNKIGIPTPPWNTRYAFTDVIKPALPFAMMNVFIILYVRSGTLLLAIMTHSDVQIGYFNAGYRLVEAFILFPSMIIAPLYPALVRKANESEEISRFASEALRIILVIACVISVPIFLLRNELTLLLYGKQYEAAASTIGILGLVMIPIGMNWVVGTLVAVTGKQSKANLYILFVTIGNIAMLVALIPSFGTEGAAFATLATECAITLTNWSLVKKYINWFHVREILIKTTIAILGATVAAFFTSPFSVYVRLSAVVVTLVGCFYFLRQITIDALRKAFQEHPATS